jgi:cation transporter-like permease
MRSISLRQNPSISPHIFPYLLVERTSSSLIFPCRLAATALHLGKIQAEFGLPIVPEDYLKSALNFGLMEVVYEWAQVRLSPAPDL